MEADRRGKIYAIRDRSGGSTRKACVSVSVMHVLSHHSAQRSTRASQANGRTLCSVIEYPSCTVWGSVSHGYLLSHTLSATASPCVVREPRRGGKMRLPALRASLGTYPAWNDFTEPPLELSQPQLASCLGQRRAITMALIGQHPDIPRRSRMHSLPSMETHCSTADLSSLENRRSLLGSMRQ